MGIDQEPSAVDYTRLEGTMFRRARTQGLRALVVGAGALGNEVVKTLGLLGVGSITVVDPDIVEPSNLTRSLLLRQSTVVGRNKAIALAEAAQKLFPDTQVFGVGREIAEIGFEDVRKADLIFSCVDSELARLEIAYVSTKLGVPVSDGGLANPNYSRGRVSYFPGRAGACFGCLLTSERRRELLTLWESHVRPCWDASTEHTYPSTAVMAAVVGSLQVEIGLRQVLFPGPDASLAGTSFEVELHPTPKLETLRIRLSPACPFHTHPGVLLGSPGTGAGTTIRALLDAASVRGLSDAVLVLDWPVCARAQCLECGHSWSPMRRLAAFRRSGRCPRCASARFREEATVATVGRDSQWAGLSLAELGLPERHLYTLRTPGQP
jgi:molybdopterin-synthase adenylyltransferase